ncbi:cobalt/nickel transport system ATP-binding protein [Thermolongibacillus altinsuensis]|jgi:cobalt/nickel transport system ATP-binding protein|uniref:Cobalt/nickel transport system ATP-binding protein n=1 Tax=Thermolongibacillus altinsuensis TaxID=575256 RepID=A0A4R1QKB8_9BACL|nr:energy-coupling factor ABC transporter ATP-binding protein [Thermolongibacillus altinsuensis]TCL47639.1 cobalt/nickel transport system ATP-binding protein [Thermolongibacillus altinsuensis]
MINVSNLSYTYPDGHQAIRDVSFHIKKGECIGLIGANGAGKSTLLQLLVGLLIPQQGTIVVDGITMTKKTLPAIRRKIGFMFQHPDDQLFMMSVYDDVAFGLRNERLPENEIEQRVTEALTMVGALHLKDRAPYRLSGGEKRLVALATILAMQPDILIMDEPTAALDPKARRTFIRLMEGLPHTKIIATHDLDLVLERCERTIVLSKGRIVYDGNTNDILTDAAFLEQHDLELPLMLQRWK